MVEPKCFVANYTFWTAYQHHVNQNINYRKSPSWSRDTCGWLLNSKLTDRQETPHMKGLLAAPRKCLDSLRDCWQVVWFSTATCSPNYWFGVVKRRKESRDSPVSADRDGHGVLGMFAGDSKKPPWTIPTRVFFVFPTLRGVLKYFDISIYWKEDYCCSIPYTRNDTLLEIFSSRMFCIDKF